MRYKHNSDPTIIWKVTVETGNGRLMQVVRHRDASRIGHTMWMSEEMIEAFLTPVVYRNLPSWF